MTDRPVLEAVGEVLAREPDFWVNVYRKSPFGVCYGGCWESKRFADRALADTPRGVVCAGYRLRVFLKTSPTPIVNAGEER